jgi:ubiquinone/menaquinone biosynthesis C-methylase UbiE
MFQLFWSGKLTLSMKLLMEANNLLSVFTGSIRDYSGMKERVKKGYEGEYSDHIHRYDEIGYHLQEKSARIQLEEIRLHNMQVLDIGCGTGALTQIAFEKGARWVVCGDISAFMLKEAKRKEVTGYADYTFCQLDAEGLPHKNGSFDAVISGMTFGTLPRQKLAITEMVRVAKPGGLVCIGAHGPEHYWEAIDATLRCINKRYVLGYRFEWWPRTEKYIRRLLEETSLLDIRSKRVIWQNKFESGGDAYDFFAAISSSWWYAKFPPKERGKDSIKTRNYFERKNINVVSDDIVVAYGYKPKCVQ